MDVSTLEAELVALHEVPLADVPIVDVSPFFDGTPGGREVVAAAVGSACDGIGFLLVTGHGVDESLIDEFYEVSKEFYGLPLDQKLRSKSPANRIFQGYACPGDGPGYQRSERQSFNVHRFDTVSDAIAAGHPADVGDVVYDALWPERPARFREVWRAYFEAMEAFAGRLLAIYERALGLPARALAPAIELDTSTLVSNYYSFDIPSPHEPSPFRFKPHLDGDIFTILHQDDGPGGLQLHQRGLGWRNVAVVPGTFVVNTGELMARWTNDRFVATPHRVLRPVDSNEQRPRMSAPFFLKPGLDAVIEPRAELLADPADARYAPVTGREWLVTGQRNIAAGYDSTAQFADLAASKPALR